MKKIILTITLAFAGVIAFAAGHTVAIPGSSNVTCNGSCNGNAASSVSGGVGPFSFSWTSSTGYTSTAQNVVGLCAGTYTVTVTDNSDMSTASAAVTIFAPTVLSPVISPADTICPGENAQIYCAGSGGTPPYTYTWTPGGLSGSGPFVVSPSTSTSYTLTVTDANGCVGNGIATIIVNPMDDPSFNYGGTAFCHNSPDINATITGLSGGIFTASPGFGLVDPNLGSIDFAVGSTGAFNVVYHTNGACPDSSAVTLTVAQPVSADFNYSSSPYCQGNNITAIPVYGSGVTAGIFSSTPGLTIISTATGDVMVDGSVPGTYQVMHIVAAPVGCISDTAIATITIGGAADANFAMVPDSANLNTFWTINTSAGSSLSYLWTFGDGANSSIEEPSHTYGSTGMITVFLEASSGVCADTAYQTVNITGTLDPCMALYHIADDTSTSSPNAYTIYNLSYGWPLTYLWDFGDTTTSTQQHPTHVYSTSSGPYEICLTIDNGSGCIQTFCDSIFSVDSISRTSNPISFTVVDGTPPPVSVGIDEAQLSLGINVYPNPFSDVTTFMINSGSPNATYSFELRDVLGKIVKRQTGISDQQFSISRNDLPNGIYFYKITSPESLIGVGKVIVK